MRSIMAWGLGVGAILGVFFALGAHPGGIVGFYRETLPPKIFIIWLAGLLAATLAPPVCAITFWCGAKHLPYGWLLHILLVPVTFAVVRGCIVLMLFAAAEPDADSLTGWATDPATLLMIICPIVYFGALITGKVGQSHKSANGS